MPTIPANSGAGTAYFDIPNPPSYGGSFYDTWNSGPLYTPSPVPNVNTGGYWTPTGFITNDLSLLPPLE